METRTTLIIKVDDETGHAQLRVTVSKWDDTELRYNAGTYCGDTIAPPISIDQSTYPYAIALLRDHTDRVVAVLLERMARGEVLLMHEVNLEQYK